MTASVQALGEQDLAQRAVEIARTPGIDVDQAVSKVLAAADELTVPRPGRPKLTEWLQQGGVVGASDHTVKQALRRNSNVALVEAPAPTDTVVMPAVVMPAVVVDEPVERSSEPVVRHVEQSAAAKDEKPTGAKGFYTVAVMCIGVSVDTSWRFFEQRLGITNVVERAVLFSVMEAALIACGWGMRGRVLRDGHPGPARYVAWALTAFAAFAAYALSGPVAGTARVVLGPLLGLVFLHLALGIEVRASKRSTTTWARIGRELRERLLSRLGLSDDHRDALARTRDRAALRAAKLSLANSWVTPFRKTRLRKALHASHVAHDLVQRERMLAELGVLQHADDLASNRQPSPWPGSTS